jgi:Holliday junction resolvasome RuvABC endonuclease subunit
VRVIGIDPGGGACGFGVLEIDACFEARAIDGGAFYTKRGEKIAGERVPELATDLGQLFAQHMPAAVIAEEPNFGIPDAVAAAMTWAAYGATLGAAARSGALLRSLAPDAWRRALGLPTGRDLAKREDLTVSGRRTEHKRLSRALVTRRLPSAVRALDGAEAGALSHAFDAFAIALAWIDIAAPLDRSALTAHAHD